MGRDQSIYVQPPSLNRRAERSRRAKETVNKAIPDILRSSPRARHGIHKSDLIVDPELPSSHGTTPLDNILSNDGPKVRLLCTDTLDAAGRLSERPFASKRTASTLKQHQQSNNHNPNVAILSFASPLKPGGGFLEGANSQEEFLCARTTVYPSLWDSFYRLPEVGGVWSPDVMVFRDSTPEANELIKRDRFFVDVISAGMLRFPETRERSEHHGSGGGCSCGVSYCDRDRELVTRKMKAVLRIAQAKGAEKIVLGAWGCGAYGNPVKEVAKIWRKVIAGSPRQRRPNGEKWQGIKEVVFAIPDRAMAREFEHAFEGVLSYELPTPPLEEEEGMREQISTPRRQDAAVHAAEMDELVSRIQETELSIELTSSLRSRQRLREVLAALNRQMVDLNSARQIADEDLTHSSDEDGSEAEDRAGSRLGDDFIAIPPYHGIEASDMEDNSFYNFDENDVASDSSDCTAPEPYSFHPGPPQLSYQDTSHDEDEELDSQSFSLLQPSPRFDSKTGWFSGSIDQLHGFLRNGNDRGGSHASPVVEADQEGLPGVPELVLNGYLERYEGQEQEVGSPVVA